MLAAMTLAGQRRSLWWCWRCISCIAPGVELLLGHVAREGWCLFGHRGVRTGSRWIRHMWLWPRSALARGWFGTRTGQGGWPSSHFHPSLEDFCSSGPVGLERGAERDVRVLVVDLACRMVFCSDAFLFWLPFDLEDAALLVMGGPCSFLQGWVISHPYPVPCFGGRGFRLEEKPCRRASNGSSANGGVLPSPFPCGRHFPSWEP